MTDRPRFFDDLAGVAGGAFSAFTGLRDEAEATIRARIDEAIRKLDLVRREDMEAVEQMAANARAGQEAAETRLAALELRVRGARKRVRAAEPPATCDRRTRSFPTRTASDAACTRTGLAARVCSPVVSSRVESWR